MPRPRRLNASLATPVGMAGKRTITRTLTANTDDAVTYLKGAFVEVINDGTTDTLWYTLDGTTPAAKGAGSHPLGPGVSDRWDAPDNGSGVIRLITAVGAAATDYTVRV